MAFRAKLADPDFAGWFAPLLADIDKTITSPREARQRVHNLHAALSALIDFLDPHEVLLPFSHKKD